MQFQNVRNWMNKTVYFILQDLLGNIHSEPSSEAEDNLSYVYTLETVPASRSYFAFHWMWSIFVGQFQILHQGFEFF